MFPLEPQKAGTFDHSHFLSGLLLSCPQGTQRPRNKQLTSCFFWLALSPALQPRVTLLGPPKMNKRNPKGIWSIRLRPKMPPPPPNRSGGAKKISTSMSPMDLQRSPRIDFGPDQPQFLQGGGVVPEWDVQPESTDVDTKY